MPLVGAWCDSRVTNLILLVMGLYRGRSVHLTRIAKGIPARSTPSSGQGGGSAGQRGLWVF